MDSSDVPVARRGRIRLSGGCVERRNIPEMLFREGISEAYWLRALGMIAEDWGLSTHSEWVFLDSTQIMTREATHWIAVMMMKRPNGCG